MRQSNYWSKHYWWKVALTDLRTNQGREGAASSLCDNGFDPPDHVVKRKGFARLGEIASFSLLISCFCSRIHYRFHSPFLSHFHSHFHSRFHSRFYSCLINFLGSSCSCSLSCHKGNKTNWHFRSSTRKLKTPRFEQLQTHVPNLMASRGVKIKGFWKKNWIQLELNHNQQPHTI